MFPADIVQFLEELEFDLLVLGGGLDHEIGGRHVPQVGTHRDAIEGLPALSLRKSPFFDQSVEIVNDPLPSLLDELVVHVVHDDANAIGRGDLGDSGTHLTGADDAQCMYFHNRLVPCKKIMRKANPACRVGRIYLFTIMAMPMPPPMHMLIRPVAWLPRCIWLRVATICRAPVQPTGWPIEMALP